MFDSGFVSEDIKKPMYHTQKSSNETAFVGQCQLNGVKGKTMYLMTFYFSADIKQMVLMYACKQWHVPLYADSGGKDQWFVSLFPFNDLSFSKRTQTRTHKTKIDPSDLKSSLSHR